MALNGPFQINKYEGNDGEIYPIRTQPETVFAANPSAAGSVTVKQFVRVGGGNRRYGLKARSITLGLAVGTAPLQSIKYLRIPIFTPTAYQSFTLDDTVTYDGQTWTVVGKNDEKGRVA